MKEDEEGDMDQSDGWRKECVSLRMKDEGRQDRLTKGK